MALSFFRGHRGDDSFDSLFDPFFFHSPFLGFPEHSAYARDMAAVANTQVDWKETSDSHVFKANLPGLSKEDVKVLVEDGRVLQISGQRKEEESSSGDKWHRIERAEGSFLRRFRLPNNANIEEVKADMKNGVLTVTVPKIVPPEPKTSIKSIDIYG
ncbi:hypothetical protein KP509_15G044800 [Ceratopteris richardii]|uniref:SHSP domain-containing protein n=1 Tax=Ceratopteris richardii TaxID=49495 RepID=A0A8T2T6L6_CERRI|nr:hypothetical protein KP509_15G044800 [Ceratopteris richardii]KAH7404820.1 hypothetical protein KP509_15G044800 [Ceratopteris richardii]